LSDRANGRIEKRCVAQWIREGKVRMVDRGDTVRGRVTVSHDALHRYSKVRIDVWRVV
jgi:hypothetical protein